MTDLDYPRMCAQVAAVSAACHATPDEVLSRDRSGAPSRARHLLYWLLRVDGLSLPQIGRLLERDHTTVLYGIERVDADADLLLLAWSLVPRDAVA